MKVQLLGSSIQNPTWSQYVTSCLINQAVAIDAGCLGFHGSPQEQEKIRHVFLTHSHADHTASLPIFTENAWTPDGECPRIYGSQETLDSVRRHIFNEVMWPDFVALSEKMRPFLHLCPIQPEVPVEAGGLWITPVPVDHVVPTFGYIVQDRQGAVIFSGDTGPTTRLWELAHQTANLRAIFLEASFPNSMKRLAEVSLHLTSGTFCREIGKLPSGVKVIAVHIKVRYRDEVVRELYSFGLPNLEIGQCEKEYEF